MNKFIHNLMDIGFGGLCLWIFFLFCIYWIINQGFIALENKLKIDNTVYFYDFIFLAILIFIFVYGIYSWK